MKFLKALVLVTAVAMLAVPLAQAKPTCLNPGMGGQAGYKAVCMSSVFYSEHSAGLNPKPVPLVTEHTGGQYDPQPVVQPTVINVTTDGGFDWQDAGIGAAGSVFLLLLAGGAAIAVQRNRTRLASF
jgi:hypothetical protein